MQDRGVTNRLLLTIPECALALGIGRTLAYALVMKGELPSVKLGRARRIPVASLEQWVAQRAAEQAEGQPIQQPITKRTGK